MKRLPVILCLWAMGAFALHAQTARRSALLSCQADSVTMHLRYVLAADSAVGSDYALCYMPELTNDKGDFLTLDPLVFRGKRNMRYVERARFYHNKTQAMTAEQPATAVQEREVTLSRRDFPWLWQGPVVLKAEVEKEGCCQVEDMPEVVLGNFRYKAPFVPMVAMVEDNTGKAGELQRDNPVLQHISQYRPYDDTRILRKEKGALYVHFPVSQSVLQHDFRGNDATLDRIEQITRAIMADTTSSVKLIQIIGLASVEGPRNKNIALAGSRAEALKRYLQQRVNTPDALYECVNGGEAWTELRDQIADSSFDGRDELLRIIDTEKDPDRCEQLIKQVRGGKAYAYLRSNILSDQRNSGYVRIYYDYVPDEAAKTINAASALLQQGKYSEALQLLLTVRQDERAQNALGVAYYMTGDKEKGIECMRRAAKNGNEQARRNMEQLGNEVR